MLLDSELMYDFITFWIETKDQLMKYFSNVSETINRETGKVICRGYLGNLRVKQTGSGFSLNGSLSKYYFGNNYEVLTRKDTERAIEKLSDTLLLSMEKAIIYRLEIGNNFILKYPINNYTSCLGDLRYFKRSEIANNQALLYINKLRALKLYNKVSDIVRHRERIPEIYSNRNVVRYELKYNKRLANQLRQAYITSNMLYDENFYISIIKKWEKEYFSIQRYNKLKIGDINQLKSVKNLQRQLAIIGLKRIGEKEVLRMIEDQKCNLGKMQLSRLRSRIRELSIDEDFTEPNDSIIELDRKIKQAVKYYR